MSVPISGLATRSNNPASAILGNTNAADSAQFTTLEEIGTNQNIEASADVKDFGIYPVTRLSNAYLLTTYETNDIISKNVTTGESSSFTISNTYVGWVHSHEVYLSIPITIKCQTIDTGDGPTAANDPLLINNPKAQMISCFFAKNQDQSGYNTANNSESIRYTPGLPFSKGLFPNRPLIQMLKSAQFYAGNNSQNLGRTTSFDQPNLSFISYMCKEGSESATYDNIGPAVSNTVSCLNTYGIFKTPNFNLPPLTSCSDTDDVADRMNDCSLEAFEKLIRSVSESAPGTTSDVGQDGLRTFKKNIRISIPLRLISEFYAVPKMLPPEFKQKIILQVYNNPTVVYTGIQKYLGGGDQPAFNFRDVNFTIEPNLGLTPQLQYRSRVLTPAVQRGVNAQWAQSAFCYNYETADYYQIAAGTTNPISANFQVSAQRPVRLGIFLTASKGNSQQIGQVSRVKYAQNQLMPWVDDNYAPIRVREIKVYISGRGQVEYSNYEDNNSDNALTNFECIFHNINRHDWCGYNTHTGDHESQVRGTISSGMTGFPIWIPITPGSVVDTSNYPIDLGAVQMRIVVNTDRPLHKDIQVNIIKIVPQQLCLDTNQKAVVIEWPARVVYRGGSTVMNQTPVRMNN